MPQRPPLPTRLGRLRNPWNEASVRAAYVLEATQLTQQIMDRFWHADVAMFKVKFFEESRHTGR